MKNKLILHQGIREEYLRELLKFYDKDKKLNTFDHAFNHVSASCPENLFNNSIYIYCFWVDESIINNSETIRKVLLPSHYKDELYEFNSNNILNWDSASSSDIIPYEEYDFILKSTIFKQDQQEYILAIYNSKRNILLLRDYTHYRNGAEFIVKFILPYLPIKRVESSVYETKLLIGADPEFCFLKNDLSVISADTLICDNNKKNKLGLDGNSSTGELRPSPDNDINKFVDHNIRSLILSLNKFDANVDVIGNNLALGFHIHFGSIELLDNETKVSNIVKKLDYFLGESLLNLSGNARDSYKQLSSWRFQPHGFEYRTLPAIILQFPGVLKIILKLAYLIVRKSLDCEYEIKKTGEDLFKKNCLKFITEKEFDVYQKFINEFKIKENRNKLQGQLLTTWKIREEVRIKINKYDPHFTESDYFPESTRQLICNHDICKFIGHFYGIIEVRGSYKFAVNYQVEFVGVEAEEFNNLCLDVKFSKNYRNIKPTDSEKLSLGLSLYLRKEQSCLKDFLDKLYNNIVEINEKQIDFSEIIRLEKEKDKIKQEECNNFIASNFQSIPYHITEPYHIYGRLRFSEDISNDNYIMIQNEDGEIVNDPNPEITINPPDGSHFRYSAGIEYPSIVIPIEESMEHSVEEEQE